MMDPKTLDDLKQDIQDMRAEGMTREDIADVLGVSLSQVKRWIKRLGLSKQKSKRSCADKTIMADNGMNLLDRAKVILGKRVTEDRRGYKLDGRSVNPDALITAAGLTPKNIANR